MNCLCCGKTITEAASSAEKEWQWHKKCVKKFFQTDTLPILDITKEQLETLARETVNEGLTVPGVQKKSSYYGGLSYGIYFEASDRRIREYARI